MKIIFAFLFSVVYQCCRSHEAFWKLLPIYIPPAKAARHFSGWVSSFSHSTSVHSSISCSLLHWTRIPTRTANQADVMCQQSLLQSLCSAHVTGWQSSKGSCQPTTGGACKTKKTALLGHFFLILEDFERSASQNQRGTGSTMQIWETYFINILIQASEKTPIWISFQHPHPYPSLNLHTGSFSAIAAHSFQWPALNTQHYMRYHRCSNTLQKCY